MLFESLLPVTTALDATSQRHRVIATNIANAQAAGYVPMRTSFTTMYAQGATRATTSTETGLNLGIASLAVRLQVEPDLDAHGGIRPVRIDEQMAALSENTLQYAILTKGLNRQLSLLSAAISEGKK